MSVLNITKHLNNVKGNYQNFDQTIFPLMN